MLEKWKGQVGKEIEVFEEFRLLTSEVISRTIFGSSYLEGEMIFAMLNKPNSKSGKSETLPPSDSASEIQVLNCPTTCFQVVIFLHKFSASINNVSFTLPSVAILQAYYFGQSNGVYTTDLPAQPLNPFNYTGTPPNNTNVINGTRTVVLAFNTSVEVVLQDTSIIGADSHPLHLHGFNFFVVGQGFGNYDSNKDPAKFNLVDPMERNTVGVPSGGWLAIRFFADNPSKSSVFILDQSFRQIWIWRLLFIQSPMRSSLGNFTQTQLREIEEVFKKFDVNGDGKISASELGSILKSLGQRPSDEELDNMIKEFDATATGSSS
ncbi:hypothetical protein GQ457_04G026590 [Hibiscus cannabinus]